MAAGLIGRTGAIVTSHVTEAYNGDADNVTTRQPVGRDRNVRAMLWRLDTVTNTPVKVTTSIGTVDCNMLIACDSSGAHLKVGRPGDQTRIGYIGPNGSCCCLTINWHTALRGWREEAESVGLVSVGCDWVGFFNHGSPLAA